MANIKCGNCGKTHYSVAKVRECYGTTAATTTPAIEPVEITEGFWTLDGDIYIVKRSQSSGYLYGLKVTPESPKGEYAPRSVPMLSVRGATVLDQAAAAAFGKLYGICCICGRTLTNPESIEAGIGPICAGRRGW